MVALSPEAICSIKSFVRNIDVTQVDWREQAETWLLEEFPKCYEKQSRKPQFSVGDEDSDDIYSDVKFALSGTQDAEVQCNLDHDLKVVPTGDGSLDTIAKSMQAGHDLRPGDALRLLNRGILKPRELEKKFDTETAIAIRRAFVTQNSHFTFDHLPYRNYDYTYVLSSCCENVLGYVPVPLGVAGPLRIKGRDSDRTFFVPMATTEGALVASTNRGCSAILKSGGIFATVYDDKMTRAPVVKFSTVMEAVTFKEWVEDAKNFIVIKEKFESTSRFANLLKVDVALNGYEAFVRFSAKTGDAMGMNMISKACDCAMMFLMKQFPAMQLIALSGNYCVDKKPSAINWIDGRGRSVVSECVIPHNVLQTVLKTTPKEMVEASRAKLEHGSSMAGCLGGGNAHAANIVAAIFIACGQDAAQVVSSSMCQTSMEETTNGDLHVTCTMPCMEVGTVGGGTILPPQNECLKMLTCAGPNRDRPGANAELLAEVIVSTVLAGELSLMAALVNDELVSSHMRLNRSTKQLYQNDAQPPLPVAPEREFRMKRNSERTGCTNIL